MWGCRWNTGGKLYNAAAALNRGKIVGFVPKVNIPNYNEFYEGRYFSPGKDVDGKILLKGEDYCGAYAEKDPEIEIHFFGEEDLQDVDARENTEDGLDFEEDDFLDELDMDDADHIDEDDLKDDPEEYEVPVSPNLIFTCPEFPELTQAEIYKTQGGSSAKQFTCISWSKYDRKSFCQ